MTEYAKTVETDTMYPAYVTADPAAGRIKVVAEDYDGVTDIYLNVEHAEKLVSAIHTAIRVVTRGPDPKEGKR